MLLYEVIKFDVIDIVTESINGINKLKATGIFQRGNYVNQNNRVYMTKTLAESVGGIKEKISNRALVGNLDHPIGAEEKVLQLLLSEASHLITGLDVKGNDVMGKLETLNTPNGQILSNLLEDKVYVGISLRGGGKTIPGKFEGREVDIVESPLKIITYDAVANPSNTMAQLKMISESVHEYVDRCLFDGTCKNASPSQVEKAEKLEQMKRSVMADGLDFVDAILKNIK